MWLIVLSDQLPVLALVSRYLTNKLIGREALPMRQVLADPQLWYPSHETENRMRY